MSDIKPSHHINHTVLPDGTTIHINDHVYLAPEHLGEPYYIGRVMEFCTSTKRKGLQARIAWFNRPKDVINRKSADPCLLVATMHSDINPVSSIRGKCTVSHKYYIPKDQMDQYRKEQDNFYYNQLYDRYIQRVYDVVPCETVQNVPMNTLEALKQRYQFIVVEQGKAADLTVARRTCCVCQEWCQSNVSVKCAGCQKSYHMSCLNPPLIRKPSKGFAWQCAFCTRQDLLNESASPSAPPDTQHKKDKVKDKNKAELKRQTRATRSQVPKAFTNTTPVTSASTTPQPPPPPALKSETSIKLKINQKKGPKNQQIKMTHMWPFRYFGINTDIDDILDVDDRIYPRAKSRIGAKYQAIVSEWDTTNNRSLSPSSDVQSPGSSLNKFKSTKKSDKKGKLNVQKTNGQKRSAEASPAAEPMEGIEYSSVRDEPVNSNIPVRGGDDTVSCIYRPGILKDEQIDDYMHSVQDLKNIPLPIHSSDSMDRALMELEMNDYHTDQAYENMAELSGDDFIHEVHWSTKEINVFEQSIREHGHDLNYAKASVQTKSMADIVRFFYQWKKTDRYEAVYSEWTKIYKPMKRFKKIPRSQDEASEADQHEQHDVDSGEESDPTIVPKATYRNKAYQCMNCLTDESKIWRRSPSDFDRKRKVFNKVLCDDCGIYWLKYAKTKVILADKRSNQTTPTLFSTSLQNGNTFIRDDKRKQSTDGMRSVKRQKENRQRSISPLRFTPTPCKVCTQTHPTQQLFTCYDCGMSVHNDCYGIQKGTEETGWRCDPCDNKINPVASYDYECVLCFKSAAETQQPLKRTAGYYWAHVQCAIFIPEIKFVHPELLSTVEYIGCVNIARLESTCKLCSNPRGACVACSECRKTVHVQCAIDHGYKLAFEIQANTHNSNKSTKYPIIPAGLFGPSSPSGLMIPQVWCPSHNITSRKLIELNARTTDETQESSTMTYVKKYKSIAKGTTPAMRRFRATRQQQLNEATTDKRLVKIPQAREAALEALCIDDHLLPTPAALSSPAITKVILTTSKKSPSPMIASKGVCSTPGCSVRHTPIWWTVDGDKKICQRCHRNQQQ